MKRATGRQVAVLRLLVVVCLVGCGVPLETVEDQCRLICNAYADRQESCGITFPQARDENVGTCIDVCCGPTSGRSACQLRKLSESLKVSTTKCAEGIRTDTDCETIRKGALPASCR